jgi:hypothetical protein
LRSDTVIQTAILEASGRAVMPVANRAGTLGASRAFVVGPAPPAFEETRDQAPVHDGG